MLENSKLRSVLDDQALGAQVTYHPTYLSQVEADGLFAWMTNNTPWQAETPTVFGKTYEIRRRTCSYGTAGLVYRYSGLDRVALPWPEQMLPFLSRLREDFRAAFNFGLCNFYPDGDAYIGKHSDDERDIVRDSPIIGLSLGATREFVLYRRSGSRVAEVALEHGSVIAMQGSTQRHFHHTVPKRKRVIEPRINITFRVLSGVR